MDTGKEEKLIRILNLLIVQTRAGSLEWRGALGNAFKLQVNGQCLILMPPCPQDNPAKLIIGNSDERSAEMIGEGSDKVQKSITALFEVVAERERATGSAAIDRLLLSLQRNGARSA